ncbi:HNH endonuclease signature motif containing protein [Rhodococcoides yunnanense]|uniref:HNH endonuclease signature motif containing protein n=1 Tax=Rhodococcoides yunnanense TaxID=278209 RepID=A0ABU4BE44_9NOCA|nr:HNH endonuclease signature motif containing protein [Rhodococcus yunnanensis]MDV6262492.1 HNH endonuclease signature motif containing protein [Rhodococcus yunnanensis]
MKTWGDVFELGNQELVSELADVTSLENALAATRLTLLAEIDRRGLAMKLGHSSVTRWYARSVRITDGSAARQNALGYWLRDHHTVLDALADGRIHAAHAAAIAEGYDVVLVADSTLDEQRRDAIVAELLDTAMRSTAGQVSSRAQALAHSAADDARARHENAEKRREQERQEQERREQERREQERRDQTGPSDHAATSTASLPYPEPPAPEPVPPTPAPRPVSENPNLNRFDVHPLANGRFQFGGDVDRLLAEKLLTALSPLTAPRPGPGGERDPRSPSKRRADALDQILDRHLRGGSRGSASGSRASVHLIVALRDLLAHGGKEQNVSATTDSMGTSGVATSSSNGGAGRDTVGSGGDAVRHEDNDRIGGTCARPDGTGVRADVAARGNMDALGDAAAGGNCAGQRSAPEPGDAGACGEAAAAGGGDSDGQKSAAEPGDADARGDVAAASGDGAGASGAGQKSAPEPGDADARGRAATGGDTAGGGAGQKSAPEPGDADWPFNLDWTGPISRTLAELLTCDADLTPVIVDDHGVPLALGRTTRLASDDQRIALTIRDTCCVMCGRPAQWCQAHHVKFWEHGGRTDLNNLALVCGECHRLVHHGDWQLIMGDDGHPYAVPPESVDPRRQPLPSYHRRKRRVA